MSKVRFSTQVPADVRARARTVVRGMQRVYRPEFTLSQFTSNALAAHAARLEQDHHLGALILVADQAPLRPGRRIAPAE